MAELNRRKQSQLSEQEMLRLALEESKLLAQQERLQEEEELLLAMKASQESEQQRWQDEQAQRKKDIKNKERELKRQQLLAQEQAR